MDRQSLAKCPQSPTKVHHWMIPMTGAHPVGQCKFCGEERQFDNSASRWDYGERHTQKARLQIAAPNTKGNYYPNKIKL